MYLFILLIIICATIGIARYCYVLAFQAPTRTDFHEYILPDAEQYIPYHQTMRNCIDALLKVPYEEVWISSFDGTKLFGRYYHVADDAPIHLMMHGYKSNPYIDFCGGCKIAADLNHNILLVDQRAHGKSEGKTITFGILERRDCQCWTAYLQERFGVSTPVFLWGLSMGAATVLMASDLDLPKNVIGILADCPYSSPMEIIQNVGAKMHFPPTLMAPFVQLGARLFGHFNIYESSAVKAVQHTNLPILLFHGDDDRFVPCDMSEQIRIANPHVTTRHLIPKAGHGLCGMVAPQRYNAAIYAFIEKVYR